MKAEVKQKVFVPKRNPDKPITIKNNDGLILIKKSKYLEDLTKGSK